MVVKVFWQENCPNCPTAKELGKKLQDNGVEVEFHDVKDIDGLAQAAIYSIMATPSIVVSEGNNEEVKSWRSVVPSADEVMAHVK